MAIDFGARTVRQGLFPEVEFLFGILSGGSLRSVDGGKACVMESERQPGHGAYSSCCSRVMLNQERLSDGNQFPAAGLS